MAHKASTVRRCRFKLSKLIRDKLPDAMRAEGISVLGYPMDDEEYIKRLKDKALEEAQEVAQARSKDAVKEELGDLLEVIHALAGAHELNYQEIEEARLKKKEEKGGFDSKMYSAYVEMDSNNPNIGYYRAQLDEC